jgi:fumarylpyruvate hydrolase
MTRLPLPTSPEPETLPVVGEDTRFPVRRIYCVGRNYVSHIREMGEADERDDPFFFQKPRDAVRGPGSAIPYPVATESFEFEGELVLAIGRSGADIPVDEAAAHVFGIAAGLDLTRRDLQFEARDRSWPWEMGKAFDASAPVGAITRVDDLSVTDAGSLEARVNGDVRQSSTLALMIWSPAEIVSRVSAQYRLEPGDLIMTGTPAGVGELHPGDTVTVSVTGAADLEVTIVD